VDIGRPHRVISGAHDLDILRVLAGSRAPMTGRQVTRLAGLAHGTAQRALGRLADAGVLDVTEAGRALMYSLNREHLAAPAIETLVAIRPRLITALREGVNGLSPAPVSSSLFGSAARGDGDTGSDIDLLVVRPTGTPAEAWTAHLDALSQRIKRLSGNHLSIHELEEADLERLREERPVIVGDLEGDAIDLTGTPIRELLRSSAR